MVVTEDADHIEHKFELGALEYDELLAEPHDEYLGALQLTLFQSIEQVHEYVLVFVVTEEFDHTAHKLLVGLLDLQYEDVEPAAEPHDGSDGTHSVFHEFHEYPSSHS